MLHSWQFWPLAVAGIIVLGIYIAERVAGGPLAIRIDRKGGRKN